MDPADGSIETPASYHRYLYAYGNPTVYIDLDGQESVSTMIDNGAERCGPLGCMGWALLKGVYTVATLGFSTVHDPVHDAYDEGRVSGKQYVGYGIGGGLAVVGVNAVTGRVGGTLMARAGAPLIAKAAVGAATGAVSGAINDAGTQAAHIGAGIQQEYDTTRTLDAMKTGAIVGGLVPVGAQAVVSTEATVKQALASRAAARLETATGQSTQVTRAAAQRETPTAAISAGNRTITQESASTAGVTAAPATRATVAAETGVANGGRAVVQISNAAKGGMETTTAIGRVKDLQNLCPGEKSLLDRLPNQGSPKANWQQNSGVLREEMRLGNPIRDASPGNTAGQFLNAERNLLMDRGWTFDPKTNYWMPPKP
ncbi:MAG: hypothetical protein LBI48_10195 [Burkholderiaceae bacterium]|jgi:hypothetical protein|nr:hypothetical protein [Burkholderiaceae bacterium]